MVAGGRAQHADLDDLGLVRDGGGLDLVGDHAGLDRDETMTPAGLGIEGHNAGDGPDAVGAELGEGPEVGLDSRATGRLGTGDHIRHH